jgi:hypothetical protein
VTKSNKEDETLLEGATNIVTPSGSKDKERRKKRKDSKKSTTIDKGVD